MKNRDIAFNFTERLEDIYDACSFIQEAGGCDKCPILRNCINETSVAEFADFVTRGSITEMLDFADDIENYANEQDAAEWYAELKADAERELDAEWR